VPPLLDVELGSTPLFQQIVREAGADRKLSGESLMIASSLVGNSLIRIDESSFD
jgi:hypothetical protein